MYGSLTVLTGPMFAGKTTELLKRVLWDWHRGRAIRVIKPAYDTRYSTTRIVSHDGVGIDAMAIQTWDDAIVDGIESVYFDEAQFFVEPHFQGNIQTIVIDLLRRGIDVTVNGLDMDWKGEPFPVMPDLLARADTIIKRSARCAVCGAPATKTHKIVQQGGSVELGAGDIYEARCNAHWGHS